MNANVSTSIQALFLVMVIILGFSVSSILLINSDASGAVTRADNENWNFKEKSISPDPPTTDDLITFTLEVNDDSHIEKIDIIMCEDDLCKGPKPMVSTTDNVYTYKHNEKYSSGTRVSYRYEIFYDNKTGQDKVPASLKTEDVENILGSKYFVFYVGENWNYKSTSIMPAQPTETDIVTFTLEVKDDSDILNVSVYVIKSEPIYEVGILQKMDKSATNTFSYTHTNTFEKGTKVGYRFVIEYTNRPIEQIPQSSATSNVFTDHDEYYFGFKIPGDSEIDGNGDDDGGGKKKDDDDGGFLPGFGAISTISSFMIAILVILGLSSIYNSRTNNRKKD